MALVASQDRRRDTLAEWVLVLCVLAIGFSLRVQELGGLGFYGDEETTALAVQGLLRDGFPHMPSGMSYWRAFPYTYIAGASVSLFGMNEFAIRLPSVIFGSLTIPLLYVFVKQLFGMFPAVLSTFLLAFSAWHITLSRLGRMYAIFMFFVVLSLIAIWRMISEQDAKRTALAAALVLATMTIHELGILLVLLWGVPLLRPRLFPGVDARRSFAWCSGLTAAWLGYHHFFNRVGDPVAEASRTVMAASSWAAGLLASFYVEVSPKWWSVSHAWEHHGSALAALLAVGTMIAVLAWVRYGQGSTSGNRVAACCAALLVLGALNLFGVVLVGCGLLLITLGDRLGWLVKNRFVRIVALELILMCIAWIGYGLLVWRGEEFGGLSGVDLLRKVVKDSTYYPAMHIMMFFMAFPIMTTIILAGSGLWATRYVQTSGTTPAETWAIVGFWILLLFLGLTKEWVELRYLMPLYVLYLGIFGWTLHQGARWVQRLTWPTWSDEEPRRPLQSLGGALSIGVMLGIIPVFNEEHGLQEAIAASTIAYGQPVQAETNGSFAFRPDHKGAGEYVRAHLQEGDRVVAMDVLQQHYYTGQVDYWLRERSDAEAYSRARGGTYYDIYTNTPALTSREELESVLRQSRSGRVWVITSAELTGEQARFVPEGVQDFLKGDGRQVFEARDKATRVYLFTPDP